MKLENYKKKKAQRGTTAKNKRAGDKYKTAQDKRYKLRTGRKRL